ncbi:N-acetyllactosaminide beta-1,3-N-acetylglucosaminyltransferase 3 [Solea senegalensis]|uniref:Hexosyltransferase n=2 Tax=Solea senegalensis TaxID=28829 RepID=A0AAV6S772_SOLSE|nr:N-acetyllactosaminide beta-1,3-N-acetylglucosaminyltransferase 3-like isoform X1 [Solea senegalensis]XP_043899403.1 N-acetyllactosaminide beta-1,3-N-acetylglucosaminyltransferase 3-like isoform X1 [Solea senegalensis]XP_043899404.1 N-acetyllactosaminide beta-1,3-N-acetylglucosaminyltransferase 3-like isoform X1 [Solea senegalensis]XP_043899405.1 N-acetyllactosaminide beta-1,3-N-acetylglucosaminyltransferase 3-like isoform X1 [Solea senegalensis]KAG7513611.1 N-acetyllactosaminide beta-1,3-N-a
MVKSILSCKLDSRMKRFRCRTFWLAVSLGVLVLNLRRNYSDQTKNLHKSDHINKRIYDVERQEQDSQIRQELPSHYVFPWPKCQENTSAANVTDFSSLPSRIKDFLYYRHCRHFPMLLDVPDKCRGADKSADVFLLLVIKSSPGNYERREVLRKTWAKERLHNGKKIHRVFISGTTDTGFEKLRQNKLLEMEHREYNDILQWDFVDTFLNLTLKQILFLEWMERNCPNARFLLNGDDDVFANTDNMVEYLQSLKDNDGGKHLFAGSLMSGDPIRNPNSKYYVPVQVEINSFPIYCSGGGFLLSGYTAMVIYKMSQSIPILPIDDVYMGMCLAKAGLKPSNHIGVKTFGVNIPSTKLDQYDPCYYKDMLLVHRFLPQATFLMWQRIHDSNLKC